MGAKSGSLANIVLTATSSAAVFINASGGNAVLKAGGVSTVTVTGGGSSSGFYIWRGSGTGTSTITIEGDVTIGADGSPIATGNNTAGIRILQETAGAATITSAATIYANRLGIWFSRNGANSGTTADSRVENTGNIHVTGGHGIYAWYARSSDTADTGDLTVTSSGDITTTAATGRGISVDYRGHGDLTVGHTGGTITSNHQGVFVSHGETGANNQAGSGDTTINIGGDIMAATRNAVQVYQIEGTGDITVMMTGGDLVATADNSDGIFIERAPNSGNEAANSGAMSVTTTGGSITGRYGIEVRDNTMYTGAVTISNGADVTAGNHGLYVSRRGNGATSITNTGGTVVSSGWNGIFVENRGADATASTDHVTVTVTGGTVRANAKADPVAAALATTPSAAAANRAKGAAVLAMNRGTGNVIVEVSGDDTMLISKYNAGIFARLWEGTQDDDTTTNNGSQIKVTQGGTIQGRKGVYAFVAPYSTAATAVARTTPAEPEVIDVTWMGTFSHGTTATVAPNDDDRFVAATVASGFDLDREVQAGQVEGSIRYGAPAGIEAQVMTWRDVVEQVAQGDRGRTDAAIADDTARQALFNTADPADPSDADQVALKARSDALVLQAKAAIENGDIMVESGSALETALAAIAAIDTSNAAGEYTVEEVAGYLAVDNIVNRAALADLMSRGLSDKEKAVLAAMATGDEAAVDTALDDEAAGFSDDYKTAVKALLDRYNVGNIRVNMTGGSIDSRGDGIRAYYATPHDDNGGIRVTVAAGTTVTGGMAGIYVANAGLGDVGKDSEWARFLRLESDAMNVRQQFVTVNGMVMGGTDAAVHLAGGGMLLVGKTGEVHAGPSGVGVLVNDPGDAYVTIHGLVQGDDGGDAAVHLTGGGGVVVSSTGHVMANGASAAIRTDEADTPVLLFVAGNTAVTGDVSREEVESLMARVTGVIPTQTRWGVADDLGPTGELREEPLRGNDGNIALNPQDYPRTPCPEGQTRGPDGMCMTQQRQMPTTPPGGEEEEEEEEEMVEREPPRQPSPTFDCDVAAMVNDRCRLYEALPSTLLAMNGLPTYEERMSAARDARGGWARVEVARGKWKADTSTRPDVAYDHSRSGLRAGMDFAAGDAGRVGVSVHGLRGSAEMTGVGEVDLSGAGLGVQATTALDGGVHVDMQAAVTWYHADLKSAVRGSLKKDVNGRGYALGVEVGKRLAGMGGGVTVTPRAGLLWSKAGLDDFDEEVMGGARVSVEDAQSLKGRAGVSVEKMLDGAGMDGSRLFASLDVEQEFKEETEVMVSGNSLKASARKTRIRTAAGAVHVWDEGRYSLQGSLGYTAGGGGNRDFGGGLSLAVKF